jgi:hypothetical protein
MPYENVTEQAPGGIGGQRRQTGALRGHNEPADVRPARASP